MSEKPDKNSQDCDPNLNESEIAELLGAEIIEPQTKHRFVVTGGFGCFLLSLLKKTGR